MFGQQHGQEVQLLNFIYILQSWVWGFIEQFLCWVVAMDKSSLCSLIFETKKRIA
jgi:hypothetical protein